MLLGATKRRTCIHIGNILLIVVVPPALVVPEGKHLRHGGAAGDGGILAQDISRRWPEHQEEVQDATLSDPLR